MIDGIRERFNPMTMSPPNRYSPTFIGDNFSAARQIDLMPPMITSHVKIAIVIPDASFGIPTTVFNTSAIELGCVNGVVVNAAPAATSAKVHASHGDRRPSRR